MFAVISGDFPGTVVLQNQPFSSDMIMIQIYEKNRTEIHLKNAEKIRTLEEKEIKELIYDANFSNFTHYLEQCLKSTKTVCFEYVFSNGKSFKAVSDLSTFHMIQKSGWKKIDEEKLSKTEKVNNTGCYVGLVIIAIIFVLMFKSCMVSCSDMAHTSHYDIVNEPPAITSFVAYGLSEVQEQKIRAALAKVGVTDIIKINKESSDEYEVFYDKENSVWVNLNGNTVKSIDASEYAKHLDGHIVTVPGKTIYKNGKAIWKAQDFAFLDGERSKYRNLSQEYVKQMLKWPDTAKFPDCFIDCSGWAMSKEKGIVIVQSHVQSENSFGMMVRQKYQIKFKGNRVIEFMFYQ